MKIERYLPIFVTVMIALGIMGVCAIIVLDASSTQIIKCNDYGSVKFRYVGSGGFFGGVQKKYIHNESENFDGIVNEVCLRGKNIFGKEIDIGVAGFNQGYTGDKNG